MIPDGQGGWRESWPTRHTAVIKLPEIKTNVAANIIVDAIGVAMSAEPRQKIVVDRYGKKLTVTYESMALSPKSIEAAIACGGHTASDILANHGRKDAVPNGWRPIRLPRKHDADRR